MDLTAGEAGSAGTPEQRAEEARAAADVMGLAARRCAGLPDSRIVNDQDARIAVVQHLRALRPRVVVTHWTKGRHPDHRIAAELTRDAAFLAGLKNFPADGEPFRPAKVVYALTFREDAVKPTFVVDISDQMERKVKALACYGSQFENIRGIGEAFPAGDRPFLEQVRATHARYGSLIRKAYGEPFVTDETTEVESLATAPVRTF